MPEAGNAPRTIAIIAPRRENGMSLGELLISAQTGRITREEWLTLQQP